MGYTTNVLERQRLEVGELQRYVGQVRKALNGRLAASIRELLEDLFTEIGSCGEILAARIKSLASDDHDADVACSVAPDNFWTISPCLSGRCSEVLDSLHLAYAHCARTTAESMSTIALLDDPESFAVLSWVWAAVRQALCLLRTYLTGTLQINCDQLPRWSPTSPPVRFSTVAKSCAFAT
jgi:hypothetical protein